MTDYYKYTEKVQSKMEKSSTVFCNYNEERKEYYISDYEGIVIYTIPADKMRLNINFMQHMNLMRFWDQAEASDYHLVTPDKMTKVKDTEKNRTLWKLEAENNYFPIHAYIDNRCVTGFNITGKRTKYHVYIAGATKPVLIYAYEEGTGNLFEHRIAIVFPVIKN